MNKQEEWKSVIQDWQSSGLSQSEYCRRSGIRENQLTYWKRKLGTKVEAKSKFIAVAGVNNAIELSVGKVSIKLPAETKAEDLADLVRCLS